MKEFSCKTQIVTDCPVAQVLQGQSISRLLVVSDPYFSKNGMAEVLGRQAKAYQIFDEVVPDPTVELVARGTGKLLEFESDAIVALGGGSAMDCAKAMRYFSGKDIPLIAVPTTSGSGSEVTDFAILTHQGRKHPLVDGALRPDLAILDGELVKNLPQSLIADGGFDVLTHALEAWAAKDATPITNALALDAFRVVYGRLGASYLGDATARSRIHLASTMAGLAFTQAGLGVCHALAHVLGGMFHVPHGRLNGILLPGVIQHADRYAAFAKALGMGSSDMMALRNLKNGLVRLRKQVRLPATLADAGIRPQVLWEKSPELVAGALADPCCNTNPVPVTESLLREILQEVAGVG